jgi:hypothetical protein
MAAGFLNGHDPRDPAAGLCTPTSADEGINRFAAWARPKLGIVEPAAG